MKRLMLIAILVAACGKGAKDDKGTPPAGSGSAAMATGSGSAGSGSAAMAAGSGSAGSAAAPDVPTEMDFEAQAKAKITDKNVEQQAKALEDDLGKQ